MIFFSEGPGICRTPVCLRGEHGLPRCVRNGTFRTRLPFEGAGYIIIGKDSVGLPDMPAFLPASCICPYARGPAAGSAQCWPGWSALRNSPKSFPESASAEADRRCPILTDAVNFFIEAGLVAVIYIDLYSQRCLYAKHCFFCSKKPVRSVPVRALRYIIIQSGRLFLSGSRVLQNQVFFQACS